MKIKPLLIIAAILLSGCSHIGNEEDAKVATLLEKYQDIIFTIRGADGGGGDGVKVIKIDKKGGIETLGVTDKYGTLNIKAMRIKDAKAIIFIRDGYFSTALLGAEIFDTNRFYIEMCPIVFS